MDNYSHLDIEIKQSYEIGDHTAIDKGFYCTVKLKMQQFYTS